MRLVNLLPGLAGHHTTPGHGLEQLLYLRGAVDELVGPELEGRVLDQLNEGYQETPGMGPVHNQSLQEDPESKRYSTIILTSNSKQKYNF